MSKFGSMALAVDVTARMSVLHPFMQEPLVDKQGKVAFIELRSKDSDRARSYTRNITQRKLDMRGRAVLSAASLENEDYGLLAELTVGWHLVDLDGNEIDLPCTTVSARELYAEPGMTWLKEQVEAFTSARGNFSKPAAKTSSDTPSTNSQPSAS